MWQTYHRSKIDAAFISPRPPFFPLSGCNLFYFRHYLDSIRSKRVKLRGSNIRALWVRSNKNPDESTGPLARPFAHSLAPLTHSLAPPCLLCLRAPQRSHVRSLARFAHFTNSLARGKVNDWMTIFPEFFFDLAHSAEVAS